MWLLIYILDPFFIRNFDTRQFYSQKLVFCSPTVEHPAVGSVSVVGKSFICNYIYSGCYCGQFLYQSASKIHAESLREKYICLFPATAPITNYYNKIFLHIVWLLKSFNCVAYVSNVLIFLSAPPILCYKLRYCQIA